ncbi:MAG TPA: outer membrane protein assembly factor BamD [Gemmatimonadales bacterium]|nr:outer membrane protein assembly factor BamD [Gemmatimonadales bacterium]
MRRSLPIPAFALLLAACGPVGGAVRAPEPQVALDASPEMVDRAWGVAEGYFRHGKFPKAITELERLSLEFSPGDPRIPRAHFYLGEAYLATKSHLQAVREFRRVSDEMPGDPLAPDALLRAGDAFAQLWRRPELDPSYGQTALGTYQEVLNRYPGTHAAQVAQVRIDSLNDMLAWKQYRAAQYYLRYKAYESAILYLKDLAATYPRAEVTPDALLALIGVYQTLGYAEDIRETCGYLRRMYPGVVPRAAACAAETPAG